MSLSQLPLGLDHSKIHSQFCFLPPVCYWSHLFNAVHIRGCYIWVSFTTSCSKLYTPSYERIVVLGNMHCVLSPHMHQHVPLPFIVFFHWWSVHTGSTKRVRYSHCRPSRRSESGKTTILLYSCSILTTRSTTSKNDCHSKTIFLCISLVAVKPWLLVVPPYFVLVYKDRYVLS